MRPKGSGGAGASAGLALLDDVPASPASRRLASTPASPRTRPIVLSPRAASVPSNRGARVPGGGPVPSVQRRGQVHIPPTI
jgi:hypothetical protein